MISWRAGAETDLSRRGEHFAWNGSCVTGEQARKHVTLENVLKNDTMSKFVDVKRIICLKKLRHESALQALQIGVRMAYNAGALLKEWEEGCCLLQLRPAQLLQKKIRQQNHCRLVEV